MALVATVTIQASQVPSDLTDFVAYIDLAGMPAGFWSTVANGGGDIRCYKADGTTELAREVVSCDTATDTGELHVKFAGVLSSSSNTEIQIHTDGTSADYAVTATFGRNAVWSGYEAVYHLSDDPSGTVSDSTGNGYSLTSSGGMVAGDVVAGKVGEGIRFDGASSQLLNIDSAPAVSDVAHTIQAWANLDSTASFMGIGGLFSTTSSFNRHYIRASDRVLSTADPGANLGGTSGDVVASTWVAASVTFDGVQTYDLYTDGSASATNTDAADGQSFNRISIGAENANTPSEYYTGVIDEFRIAPLALTADWIATEYANQNTPATFYSIAANDAGGVDNVTPTGITTTPTLGTPAVGQVHALSATGIETTPTLGTPAVGQIHNLTATGIVSSLTLGRPTAGSTANTDSVAPVGIVSSVTLGLPSVGQTHVLTSTGVVSTPSLGTPTASAVSFVTLTTLAAGASITVYKSANGWFDI